MSLHTLRFSRIMPRYGMPTNTQPSTAGLPRPLPSEEEGLSQRSSKPSTAATASLVLSIVSMFCIGPIAAIPAIIVGIYALVDSRSSKQKSGSIAVAIAGIAVGVVVCLVYGSLIGVLVSAINDTENETADNTEIAMPADINQSPTIDSEQSETPSEESDISASFVDHTTEYRIDKITVVDIEVPPRSSLETELRRQIDASAKERRRLLLQTSVPGCRPCLGVAAALTDPKMQAALADIRLVRVDARRYHRDLDALGIDPSVVPSFFLLDRSLRNPSNGTNGGEWHDDTADNIAPVLDAFLRGKLNTKSQPSQKPYGSQQGGTIL